MKKREIPSIAQVYYSGRWLMLAGWERRVEKGESCSCVDIPRLLTFNQLLRLLDYVVLDIRRN
jgi:hypothetical protein